MYYDIVNSGERIKELRAARRMTRQQLAEQIGLSVDALRKIEAGVNGAKIDTLISIAELFHITLDYLVCGCERKAEVDDLLVGLKENVIIGKLIPAGTGMRCYNEVEVVPTKAEGEETPVQPATPAA